LNYPSHRPSAMRIATIFLWVDGQSQMV